MPQPLEIGKQFLDDVLALIPEDKREEARSKYSRAQDTFQSTMTAATSELEAQREGIETWRGNLSRWKQEQEQRLIERERAIATKERQPAAPVADPALPPAGTPPAVGGLSRDDIAPLFDDFGRAVVGATSEVFRLSHRYAQLYPGQEFNPETLFAHPLAKTAGLSAAFNELHKEKITAAQAAAQADAEAKVRADERAKVIAEFGSNKTLPFPGPGDEDNSPFGYMARKQADNQERFGAEAAAEEFNRLRMTRPA